MLFFFGVTFLYKKIDQRIGIVLGKEITTKKHSTNFAKVLGKTFFFLLTFLYKKIDQRIGIVLGKAITTKKIPLILLKFWGKHRQIFD